MASTLLLPTGDSDETSEHVALTQGQAARHAQATQMHRVR